MDLLAYTKAIAERIEAEATQAKVPVAVCVIDIHGNIILKHRMNGAPTFSLELSERKAYTSALVGLRTADLSPLVQPGQALYPLMGVAGGRFCSMGGGAPLKIDGQLVAGVGISGGTVDQDVAILEAGLREPAASEAIKMNIEVIVLPVADADRAKRFYGDLGWRLDHRLRARRLPRDPVHPARLGMFDHFRQERDDGVTGFSSGTSPDRFRYRRPRAASSIAAASRSAMPSTMLAASSTTRDRASLPQDPTPSARAMPPMRRSATPTAMAGCSRRSRHG